MEPKIDWMVREAGRDGFELTPAAVQVIIDGGEGMFDPAVVDYVEELNREWAEL